MRTVPRASLQERHLTEQVQTLLDEHSPDAARAALRDLDVRFPYGALSNERKKLAARLAHEAATATRAR